MAVWPRTAASTSFSPAASRTPGSRSSRRSRSSIAVEPSGLVSRTTAKRAVARKAAGLDDGRDSGLLSERFLEPGERLRPLADAAALDQDDGRRQDPRREALARRRCGLPLLRSRRQPAHEPKRELGAREPRRPEHEQPDAHERDERGHRRRGDEACEGVAGGRRPVVPAGPAVARLEVRPEGEAPEERQASGHQREGDGERDCGRECERRAERPEELELTGEEGRRAGDHDDARRGNDGGPRWPPSARPRRFAPHPPPGGVGRRRGRSCSR